MKIETLAVHAGRAPDPATGAVREPIQLSTTFERGADGSYPHGHNYSRTSNPNRGSLERAIELETDHLSLYLLEVHEGSEVDFLRRERINFTGLDVSRNSVSLKIANPEQIDTARTILRTIAQPPAT